MPNLLAHNLLVKRFSLKEDKQINAQNSFIHGNFEFLSMGAQGPDPLFYVGLLPSHGLHLLTAKKKMGNQIHKTDAKKFFRLMIDRYYGLEVERYRQKFEAFIFGQLAHYLLDRETHPYILYASGFGDDGRISGKYHFLHANFESNIDACLAKKFKMNYFLENPGDALPKNKDNLNVVDKELVPTLSLMFGYDKLPKHLYTNAMQNMYSMVCFTNHNSGWKKKILPKRIMGISVPDPDHLDFEDPLNERKETWLDPVTGAKHNESFLELHNRAFDLLQQCYHDIQTRGFNYEVVSKYLNGLDYYGVPVGSRFVYQKK